jgi:hypothetical protein
MGFSAISPSNGTSGIVEADDVPFKVQFAYPSGLPDLVPPGLGLTIPVEVYGLGGADPSPGTGTVTYVVDGADPVTVDMDVIGPGSYEAHLPAAACGSIYGYYFSVQEPTLGTATDPPTAPAADYQAFAAAISEQVLFDDLEEDTGWIVGAPDDDAERGIWNRVDPEATSAQPEDDHTESPGTICWVTDGRAGSSAGTWDVDDGKTTLTSPAFAIEGSRALLSYWRWYSNDAGGGPNEDVFRVWISNDGGANWHLVETVGPDGPEAGGGWFYHEFFANEFVVPSQQMKMRFVAEDVNESSLVEAAIDDFEVIEYRCSLSGDFDDDGDVDLDDHVALADCLAGPDASPDPTPPVTVAECLMGFDFDTDQDVDINDAAEFAAVFSGS